MSECVVLSVCLLCYLLSAVSYSWLWRRQLSKVRNYTLVFFVLGALFVTGVIAGSWWSTGRPPFKTLYESLLLFAWCTSVIYLGLVWGTGGVCQAVPGATPSGQLANTVNLNRRGASGHARWLRAALPLQPLQPLQPPVQPPVQPPLQLSQRLKLTIFGKPARSLNSGVVSVREPQPTGCGIERAGPILGAGVSTLLAVTLGYAMTHRDLEAVSLPPALQSPWFVPHVLVYFLGYGALLVSAVAAVACLVKPCGGIGGGANWQSRAVSYAGLMHGLIVAGYILLTAGLILGAVWAKDAWGNYWGWDPKENWALISWLTYTLYFHLRRLSGWNERSSAWWAIGGFAVIIFTYLGISLLPTGDSSVHTYQ